MQRTHNACFVEVMIIMIINIHNLIHQTQGHKQVNAAQDYGQRNHPNFSWKNQNNCLNPIVAAQNFQVSKSSMVNLSFAAGQRQAKNFYPHQNYSNGFQLLFQPYNLTQFSQPSTSMNQQNAQVKFKPTTN